MRSLSFAPERGDRARGTPASILVAGDTSHRAVGIAAYSFVIRVRLRLVAVRARVTNDAGEDRIVCGIDVAVGADGAMVRLLKPGVVKRCAEPIRRGPGGVAGYASGGVLRGDVIRHAAAKCLRALPGCQMATVAVCVRCREAVIVADVARSTRRGHMGAGQRPTGGAVIKLAIRPEQGVVTSGALGSGEARGDVIRHIAAKRGSALPGGDVATITIRVCRREGVVVANVAVGARHDFSGRRQLVRTSQRPARRAVIENR